MSPLSLSLGWTDKKALNVEKLRFQNMRFIQIRIVHVHFKFTNLKNKRLEVTILKIEAILKLGSVRPSVTVSSFR